MSREKEKLLVIDTETANSMAQPMPYDIGYAIVDRDGNFYLEKSFIIADIFFEQRPMMKSAYYNEKIPQYLQDIDSGKRVVKSLYAVRIELLQDMKNFKVKKVYAYNINFDLKALENGIRYTTKSKIRSFFPKGSQFFCLWNMACQTILNTNSYIEFALKNGFESDAKNLLTNAEVCYRYIKNTIEFEESHTALEDVKIETEILKECYKKHKKMNCNADPCCWRIPQKKRKELETKKIKKVVDISKNL